jgi:hypothetical protein
MHTCDEDLGTAPKMPDVGTRVRIRDGEIEAVVRQTLDSEPRDSPAIGILTYNLCTGSTDGVVTRSAHTNGDIRLDTPGVPFPLFAYGAQVEPIQ